MSFDPRQRRFTIICPIHTDLYGGVIKIIAYNSPMKYRGRATPIIGLRWQAGDSNAPIEEMHYTLDGEWDSADKVSSNYDLWDADLTSIRPLPRGLLGVISNVS